MLLVLRSLLEVLNAEQIGDLLIDASSLITGNASGASNINGSVITANSSLINGSYSASALKIGSLVSNTVSLILGQGSGAGEVDGETVQGDTLLITNGISGQGNITGTIVIADFNISSSVQVSGDANVSNSISALNVGVISGQAIGDSVDVEVSGQILNTNIEIVSGAAEGKIINSGGAGFFSEYKPHKIKIKEKRINGYAYGSEIFVDMYITPGRIFADKSFVNINDEDDELILLLAA